MRIASYISPSSGTASFGLVVGSDSDIIDLGSRCGHPDVSTALEKGGKDALHVLGRQFADLKPDFRLADVKLLPAVPSPLRKVICIGLNYRAHVAEVAGSLGTGTAAGTPKPPENPRLFSRFADTIVAHGDEIWRPRNSTRFDYEGALAVIIGKPGRHIPVEDALDHVAGYTIFNDGSVRDFQQHSVTAGKNFPNTGPLGPWITTSDEIPDPSKLTLQTRVNGEVRQSTTTDQMIYSVKDLISYCSSFTPLNAGDVIATGTPSGVAHARNPPPWLVPGDVVEIEISCIGTLRNKVVDEPL